FTAGLGENTRSVRKGVVSGLEAFGVKLDEKLNEYRNDGKIHDIAAKDSKVRILVIPTNEELVIARETAALL
ncbi:MAG: acetate kinase, partial [Clostridia bacterium]|nr:acetate kinase [Clostridia bacterium]